MLSLVVTVAMAATWSCEDEDTRVTRHLEDGHRAKVLGDLALYIRERQFPRASGDYGPVFIDDDDHHCAMGALLAWNGAAKIANHIRATRNLAAGRFHLYQIAE